MKVSSADIQKLREVSGAGVMDSKKALEDAGGDFDKALAVIREKGLAKVAKREGRETGAGLIYSYVHAERIGVLVDLRAETDFVVRSDPFRSLAHELAMQIAAAGPENVDELLKQPYIRDEKRVVENLVQDVIAQVGENVRVNKFYRLEL